MPLTHNATLITQNSTDYHCHLLPGMDDGAATLEESLIMARTLCAAGYTTVCCTPHLIKGTYESSAAVNREKTAKLQQHLAAESIPLTLLAGAEYYLDEYLPQFLNDPLPLGESKLLLIEIPNHAQAEFVKQTCYRIKMSGYTPLIAHPERCTLLALPARKEEKTGWKSFFSLSRLSHQSPVTSNQSPLLPYLQEIGCKFQGNLGSFAGAYGNKVKNKAIGFLQNGLYDCFGSDAHTPDQLEGMLKRGMQAVELLKQQSVRD